MPREHNPVPAERGASAGEQLQTALAHQHAGRLQQAMAIYQQVIAVNPQHPDALHYMGMAAHEIGEDAMAIDFIGRALSAAPAYAEAHNNLGNIHFGQDNFDAAAVSYQRAIASNADYIDAHCNLGGVLHREGKHQAALASFERVLAIEPENGVAQHMIAAIRGAPVESAPRQYVAGLFDAYADKFDTHLAQALSYEVPQRLVALASAQSVPTAKWDVLDLGCGTGLVGVHVASHAGQLVGVDLSGRMLHQALSRGIYTRLIEADILEMLRAEPAASYDLVAAGDVFIYVGRLDEIVEQVQRVLRSGGMFAFSVESPDAEDNSDVKLKTSARFGHAQAYLARLAATHRFDVVENQPARIRVEMGAPVPGFIALWKKRLSPPAAS